MMKLGADLGMFPEMERGLVDELLIITQPAHIQKQITEKMDADQRDIARADQLRDRLRNVRRPIPPEPGAGTSLDKSPEA
jgi:protein arginine kinase